MTYSMEYRRAVAAAYEQCESSLEVAAQFHCSESWVRRLMQRYRVSGSLEALPIQLPNNYKLDDKDLALLAQLIADKPDLTLVELAAALPKPVSVTTVHRATKRLHLSFKKKTLHAAEQDRADVKAARDHWLDEFQEVRLDQLVFIDEFGAATNMTRRYARGPVGRRVVCKTPHGHWKLLSTIAAMNTTGVFTGCTFDGAVNTDLFVVFIEEFLVPALVPGQVVVLDNLSAHKSPRIDVLIQSAGCRLLRLPPYSPDFNPIEMAISKMKSLLRKLSRRTIAPLIAGIGQAMQAVTAHDARAFMEKCGYAATVA